ncbi:hypothetical protein FLA_0923 [Filimonas lacunae]|nr:hypothetical protein FLA_0923 [Filimonas lacunae]
MESDVRSFFLNNEYKKSKKELWELFTAFVYFRGEIDTGKEISDMLSFFEQLVGFLLTLNRINNRIIKLNQKP